MALTKDQVKSSVLNQSNPGQPNFGQLNPESLIEQIEDAHARTLTLVDGLTESQLMGPKHPQLNPLRWEIAHAAYFYEYWIMRTHYKQEPYIKDVDKLFDSIGIEHDERWDLPLPPLDFTYAYMEHVKQRTVAYLSQNDIDPERNYLAQYAVYHEDMHCEAFTYERQTLAYPTPDIRDPKHSLEMVRPISGDAEIPGGIYYLGAEDDGGFVFDNEKWIHPVEVSDFQISRTTVTNEEYSEFVESGAYQTEKYWDIQAWQWLQENNLQHPIYWKKQDNQWYVRKFDQWQELQSDTAVVNVSWYEAKAFCHWANRRLPTEVEWEIAASAVPNKQRTKFPWGNSEPNCKYTNLDGCALGPISVHALPEGDSAFGCRQMLGNVWEWTDSIFSPYPGFTPDMYADYSQPLFGCTRVMRGGSWVTRARLMRNTYRNYYGPERNDVFVGFRTCAL